MSGFALVFSSIDLDVLTRTVDGEARGEILLGQQAVAWVARTRADWDDPLDDDHPEHEWWGTTIAKVCEAHYQFSCWNGGPDTTHIQALTTAMPEYQQIQAVVQSVLNGTTPDPTGGATHYKVRGTPAEWDKAVARLGLTPVSIGQHDFYRLGPSA